MDGALDRHYLKGGTVTAYPDQPDLTDMLQSALTVLSRHEGGFVLLVESGLIDKFTHALDWERAVYDVIMLDRTVALAKAWAERRGDTLIMVVADHTHPVSIIGTYDDNRPGAALRNKLGIYNLAGFPNYPGPDDKGYPPSVEVSRRLAFTFGATPDRCETGKPTHVMAARPPTLTGTLPASASAEERCRLAGAQWRPGNLPAGLTGGIHSAEDAVLTAMGPGSEQFHGRIDNTRVFRFMATALGLGVRRERRAP
jgi:alkaline phosphatase